MNLLDAPPSLLALLDVAHADQISWPEPQEITRPLPPVVPFDVEMLPQVLRPRVVDVAYRMQCPQDFVAIPSLVMFGALIGTGCAIRPKQHDDWYEYPNLWGGVVARPGTLKSPAFSEALAPLRRLEKRAADEHLQAMAEHHLDKITRKMELDRLQKVKDLTREQERRVVELSQKIEEPKQRRVRTQDATVEMLGQLASENPRGILVDRDELVGLLANLDREGQQCARSLYLESWNGKNSFHTDRIGRGSIYIEQLCLSVLGGVQPGKLREYLYDAHSHSNDGLIQRFQLLVYPDDPREVQIVDRAREEEALAALERVSEQIAYGDFSTLGATREERHGRVIHFFRYAPDAQARMLDWLAELYRRVRTEEIPIMAEHLNKFRKLVPGLSLIFHILKLAADRQVEPLVPLDTLERAIRMARYLESHARRIYGSGTDYHLLAAERLAREISMGTIEDGFSERDVYRKGWHYLDRPDMVRAACRELEEAGWIQRIPVEFTGGRPPSPAYTINPKARG